MIEKPTLSDELTKPIPLEARLTFAEIDEGHANWRHATDIASSIDTYETRVTRYAGYLGLPYDERLETQNGKTIKYYPPYTGPILMEEFEWKEAYGELPSRVDITTIVESIGRSYGWTMKTLGELGIHSGKDGLYPRNSVKKLRHISMSVPLDDGWYNLHQLVLYSQADREWIEKRLDQAGYVPQRRRSSLTGKIHLYYDPSSADIIFKAINQRPEAAGDWLTTHAIAILAGRTEKWVSVRLEMYQNLGLIKQDDMGVPRRHWSPGVAEMVVQESNRLKALPDGSEFLNIHKFARRLGHASDWAMQIFSEMKLSPEEYRDGKGRSAFGYREALIPEVLAFDQTREKGIVVTDKMLLESLFAVGSLQSKIRLLRKKVSLFKSEGLNEEDPEVDEILRTITDLSKERKLSQQRHYRLVERVENVPAFIASSDESD